MWDEVCSHHKNERRKSVLRCCACLIFSIFLILLTVLLIWAILKPKKPRFTLEDATIFTLNVSAPNVISTSVQVTINSRNPNSRIGIYYDKMYVYATYSNQQITFFTVIPPVYQGHKDVNVWSPFVYGSDVPIAPYNGIALSQVQSSGAPIEMTIKIDGRLKWKVGSLTTGRYHIHVNCPVSIKLGNSNSTGITAGNGVKYQISQRCSVSV
ncbi:NDR1/HIN1-like protein 1 [Primulina huaijiensis]|uniref:NDR1/HIN1-like protein 1 n=1 Tax=Primulina huaijiensis TaxID=1492673 RepID=UPI003CC7879D